MAASKASDNVRIVEKFFDAIGRMDEQSLVELCTDDIEWTVPGKWSWAGTHRGHAGLRYLFKTALGTADITSQEIYEYVEQGHRIMAIGFATGSAKATKKTFEDHFIFSITIRDGKMAKVREYIDTQAVAEAFGPDA